MKKSFAPTNSSEDKSSEEKPCIVRVAVPSPLPRAFDYKCAGWEQLLKPGMRVRVPFGTRELVGVVVELVNETSFDPTKIKSMIELLDTESIFPATLFKLLMWASAYYHHPIGEVMMSSLPKALREGKNNPVASSSPVPQNLPKQPPHYKKLSLNAAQERALQAIVAAKNFHCFLLEGVTGSGKTEIYLQAIELLLQRGGHALVLVPEIGLTPQTVARFSERFKLPVLSYHSAITEKQRLQVWCAVQSEQPAIVIGTRSALFLPIKNLKLIILDEEHDLSFKQQSGFRYSARDCAVQRAYLENIPVVLGSATPSLESFYNVQRGRYQHLILPERAGGANPPAIHLINLRDQVLQAGLSPVLIKAMQSHLAAGSQVLLFLNRRGFAPVCLCHHCGWLAECDRCDAKLILHQHPKNLRCHHCDAVRPLPPYCPKCQSAELMPVGQGTEQLEQRVQELFPEQKVVRIDRDSTRAKGRMDELLQTVHNGEARILIGTQMLAKGHHFPALGLVAIVDADGGLFSTDFRALERMGQLIVQVAGRAGRAEQKGEVYIQTHQPEHSLLQLLLKEGYPAFMQALLVERQQALLPPFSHWALIRAEANSRAKAMEFLEKIKTRLAATSLQLLGPIHAAMERKAGRFRAHLVLQAPRPLLQEHLNKLNKALMEEKASRQVRWFIDIDPQESI